MRVRDRKAAFAQHSNSLHFHLLQKIKKQVGQALYILELQIWSTPQGVFFIYFAKLGFL